MPRPILHLHIPRTAGSSLQTAFDEIGHFYRFTSLANFCTAAVRGDLMHYSGLTGHFCFGLHDYFEDPIYFIALREPVARVKSLFAYMRQNKRHPRHACVKGHDFTIEDLYRSPSAKVGVQFSNGQTRQLNGHHLSALKRLSDGHLNSAMRVLERDDVVIATMENLRAGLGRLADRLGLPPINLTISNTSRAEPENAEFHDLIRKNNEFDIELYRRACELDCAGQPTSSPKPHCCAPR